MKKFFLIVGAILSLGVIGMLMQAWAVVTLWAWFITPYGVAQISMATAIGVSLIITLFITHPTSDKTGETKSVSTILGELAGRMLLTPLVTVGIGWVVTLFI